MGSLVEIADVSLSQANWEQLRGCYIDLPKPGSRTRGHAVAVAGWVLGRGSPAVAVELVHQGDVFRRVPLGVRRPDVAEAFPEAPGAEHSGFRTTVNVAGTEQPGLEVGVRAVLEDQSRAPIGVIRAWQRTLRGSFQPRLQPLMITTLGRTGSNWLMRLLGQHQQILTYRPFEFEPRVGSYWMQILDTLSKPASYLQPINATDVSSEHWWLGNEAFFAMPIDLDLQILQWFERNHADALVAFCSERIEAFYEQVALIQGKSDPVYFAEKYLPESVPETIWDLYPQGREIVLVRDFRDVFCSILAFNTRRGYAAFARERVKSDEDYVQKLRIDALRLLDSWKSRRTRAHLLRYEDLVLRPVETLGALLAYLGLDTTPSMVEATIQRASEELPLIEEHRTSPAPKTSIGRWRRDLDASLQVICQKAFGDILKEFGYDEEASV